jgi:hypothetical protein
MSTVISLNEDNKNGVNRYYVEKFGDVRLSHFPLSLLFCGKIKLHIGSIMLR